MSGAGPQARRRGRTLAGLVLAAALAPAPLAAWLSYWFLDAPLAEAGPATQARCRDMDAATTRDSKTVPVPP